jgi:hypothetical protein
MCIWCSFCNLYNEIFLRPFQTTFNNQPAVVVYTVVIQCTEQRQYQTGSCQSLHCQTAACNCVVSGSVLGGVKWHSPCTECLTAEVSSLYVLTFPPPLHTTYHSAVPSCDILRAHSGSLQQAHLSIFSPFDHCSIQPIMVQYRHVTFTVHTVAHCSRLTFQFSHFSTTAPQHLS